jgi:hypothetical protein
MFRFVMRVAALVLAACAVNSAPIPVQGDLDPLVGEWSGSYSSTATGRQGSIVFTLVAGRDTATGDVMMTPSVLEHGPTAPLRPEEWAGLHHQVLRIRFVRCEGNQVTGWLNPYQDPDSGDSTYTKFSGTIANDVLEGTFVSHFEPSGRRITGTWYVKRARKVPAPR